MSIYIELTLTYTMPIVLPSLQEHPQVLFN